MINKLDEAFRFHEQALSVRVRRSEVLSSNIANADTPNYHARDFDFAAALRLALSGSGDGANLAATNAKHIAGGQRPAAEDPNLQYRVPTQPSIDGNTVELDVERAKYADNALHYEANLNFVSGQIKSLLTAIQG